MGERPTWKLILIPAHAMLIFGLKTTGRPPTRTRISRIKYTSRGSWCDATDSWTWWIFCLKKRIFSSPRSCYIFWGGTAKVRSFVWRVKAKKANAKCIEQVPGRLPGTVGQNPSVSQVQPVTCCWSFGFSVLIWSIFADSSKLSGNSAEVFNFNRLFLKLNRLICN